MRPARLVLLTVLALSAGSAWSDAKSLRWRAMDVRARLDADGRLHVEERQAMVFDGDWNGGERRFRLEPAHSFDFRRLTRIDPATGRDVALAHGSLDNVDHYRFTDRATLRWRARSPSDPPFRNREIVYVLEYTLGDVLVPAEEGRFLLSHDFALPERPGPIEKFTLYLSVDPAWSMEQPLRYVEAGPLRAGVGYVVRRTFRYIGAGRPAAAGLGAAPAVRYALAGALVAGLLLLFGLYRNHERGRGRTAPLEPVTRIDEAWLQRHIFAHPPEVVGAAWDDHTGVPEVGATIARLVSEGKMSSKVEESGLSIFKRPVLELTLKVPRDALEGHERELIDGLFVEGDTTDTDLVRAHYKTHGFDPAGLIRKALDARSHALGRGRSGGLSGAWLTTAVLLASGGALLAASLLDGVRHVSQLVAPALLAVAWVAGTVAAQQWRKRVDRSSPGFMVPLALLAALAAALLAAPLPLAALAGTTLLALGFASSILNVARTRDGPERMAVRKRLGAARRYFVHELRKPRPALRDEWMPYLIALELGPDMDRWFGAFGPERERAHGDSTGGSIFTPAGSASRDRYGNAGWTGGGGSFGGAGASASWGSALTSFAGPVASASSGSSGGGGGFSGGGGGGGSRSGGGGGGGW